MSDEASDEVNGRRTRAEQLVDRAIAEILAAAAAERHTTFEVLARQVDEGTLSLDAAIALQRTLRVVVSADVPVNPAIQGRALAKLARDADTGRAPDQPSS
jgi:hypothetical protein